MWKEMSRNNRNSKQWSWCQTTTFYGSSIKVVTLSTLCWCYHITHHSSPCVCVYFLPLQSKVAGCCSLQLQSPAGWPCTHPHPLSWPDTRMYSHHITQGSDQNLFQEFSTKQDRYWGRLCSVAPRCTQCWISRHHHQQQAVVTENWKTGNCLVTTMKSHWILEKLRNNRI